MVTAPDQAQMTRSSSRPATLTARIPATSPRRRLVDPMARSLARIALRRAGRQALEVVEDWPHAAAPRPRTEGPPAATVTVHHPAAYRAALLGGSVGVGRSYAAGWWDCDDLVALFRIAIRALPTPGTPLAALAAAIGRLRGDHSGRANPAAERMQVQAHYDLGDEFFASFLDATLTYSCGVFESPNASMEQASAAKLERICRMLRLEPDHEVLEIGTGWGSFALHAASRYGCRVTTTTVSDRQFAAATRRVHDAGLERLVTVCHNDYRDLQGTYDRVVSIEMIEAVGWRNQDTFFSICADRLRAGGAMALQAIVIDDRLYEQAKRKEDFVKAMVFPGSTIPSEASIADSVARTDLRVVRREAIGPHYVQTLAQWRERFQANRDRIRALGYGPELLRLWDLYLAYCQAGFAERRLDNVQLLLAKPRWKIQDLEP